jgi:hypothetical protein
MSDAVAAVSPLKCILPTELAKGVAPTGWDTAVANVQTNGTFTPSNGAFPPTMGIADIQGARDATHQADYMNLWGGRDSHGNWHTSEVTFVSEKWELRDDGRFYIDQWLHQLNPDGTTARSMHQYLVENQDGRVFGSGSYHPTPEESAANLQALVSKFGALQPAPSQGFAADQRDDGRVLKALRQVEPCMSLGVTLPSPGGSGGFSLRPRG